MAILTFRRLLVIVSLYASGCGEIPRNTASVEHFPARDHGNETAVISALESLGDLAYENPERVVGNPDSVLGLLPGFPETTEGKEIYAWLLLNIGYALREYGNLLESVRYYEKALAYGIGNGLEGPDFIDIAKPLANLYTQIGDLQKAEHLQKQTIFYAARRGRKHELASLYSNLAIVYQQLGWPDSLQAACRKGLEYADRGEIAVALLYNGLVSAYRERLDLDSARFFNKKALALFQNRKLHADTVLWYTGALYQLCDIEAADRRYDKSLRAINSAINLAEMHFPHSKQRDKAKYYFAKGNICRLMGKADDALSSFRNSLELFASGIEVGGPVLDYTYTEALWGMARSFASRNVDSAAYYYIEAIEHAYHAQQLITSKESSYSNSAWSRELLAEALVALKSLHAQTGDTARRNELGFQMLWCMELSKGRQLLQELERVSQRISVQDSVQEGFSKKLRLLYSALASESDAARVDHYRKQIRDIEFALQLDEGHFDKEFEPVRSEDFYRFVNRASFSNSLVSYFFPENGVGSVVFVENGQCRFYEMDSVAFIAEDIRTFVKEFFSGGPIAYENAPDRYASRAETILGKLIPFYGEIDSCNVIISPDGLLFTLPFDALVSGGRFLAEEKNISNTYTLLLNKRYEHSSPIKAGINCFARSRYDGTLPDLPFVEAEKDMLAGRFGAKIIEGRMLNDSVFFDALASPAILHVSAHAVADDATTPYIAFDRPLTLDKLNFAASRSPLAVLSACHTAAGTVVTAEGLESLNKAFIGKGALGIVATYWSVDDGSMSQMMEMFYEQLQRRRVPSLALAEAKRLFLEQQRNPYYWAGLNYTGVQSEIILPEQPYRYGLVIGALAIVFVFAAAALIIKKRSIQ